MAMEMPIDNAASVEPPRALGRLLLPVIKLHSSTSSKQLEQQLSYLWTTAHAMLATSPAIAHATAATIMETARRQRTTLPSAVLDYLCQQCGGLIVPSVSADVRVVAVNADAPANRKLARLQQRNGRNHPQGRTQPRCERLQNVVEIKCRRCGFANIRHGASVVYKPKVKKLRANKPKKNSTKRPIGDVVSTVATDPKRAKTSDALTAKETLLFSTAHDPTPPPPAPPPPRSVFAKPISPPRRLLDSKKKKKKKPSTTDATAQVKSTLDSFLQTFRK